MAAVAITNTFTNNTVADGSQVNTNFADLVTYINNRNDGSVTWDRCLVTSSSAVPLIVNNSTGTSNIVNFQDNGTNVLSIVDGGATRFADGTVALPSISFLSDTNTGIFRGAADNLSLVSGGTTRLEITNTETIISPVLRLPNGTVAAPSLILDVTDTNTGLYWISADNLGITAGGILEFTLNTSGLFPMGTGLLNAGDATNYWNDISYKTLTDRGCLGCFDKGVELQDGRIVSDTEALLEIKTHPTKKTIYGVDMFDYRTFPKVAYKKALVNEKLLPRDENDEPVGGSDGVEMTSMFSIMIGAIKELTNRIKVLEAKNG